MLTATAHFFPLPNSEALWSPGAFIIEPFGQTTAEARNNLGPITRQGLWDVLIGSALVCPFGIELRIGLIGFGQGLGEAFTASWARQKAERQGDGKSSASGKAETNARSEHAPRYLANLSGTPNHINPQQPRPSAPLTTRYIYLFRGRCPYRQTAARGNPMILLLAVGQADQYPTDMG